jgi:hypothetical protein
MKVKVKQIFGIIFLVIVNMFVSIQAYGQAMIGDTLYIGEARLSRSEAQERFRQEVERLKAEASEMLPATTYERIIEQVSLFGDGGGELLFAAANITQNNLDEFHREFPILAAITELKFIGDVDADGTNEIVGSWSYESQERQFYVFKQKAVGVIRYEYKMITELGRWQSLSVRTTPDGDVLLVGRAIVAGHLPVKGDRSRSVEYESLYETDIRFTGMTFELVTPMHLVKQEVILDN